MSGLKGTVVGHRYELLGLIAEGGQALICRALDRQTGRLVAVKLLTSFAAQNREFVERLAREQEAMIALAGTSAVAVLDLCRAASGAPCLVMELLQGGDLEQYLCELEDRGERLSFDRVYDIFDPIVETLERAHGAGILHRDLKPANIFLLSPEKGGGVRLLDFGLSRMKTASPLTATGTIMGSPSYIAPEVWKGKSGLLDQRVDVYSLAVILFRVLSGRLPFDGQTLHEKFLQTTTAPRPRLSALRPDLLQHKEIDQWVQQALAIEPAKRFATARALWISLLAALQYAPVAGPRAPVGDGVVSAWRAAAGAFRRIIAGLPTPVPPPPTAEARPSPPEPSAEWLQDDEVMELEEDEPSLLDDIFQAAPGALDDIFQAAPEQPPEIDGAPSSSRTEEGKATTADASSSGSATSRQGSEVSANRRKRTGKESRRQRKRRKKLSK
jgi:serine/threonine-protein kinase